MMAGITLEEAETQLANWIAASTAVSSSQQYEIDTGNGRRVLRRADAGEIRQMIDYWDSTVKRLAGLSGGGRRRTRYVVPE